MSFTSHPEMVAALTKPGEEIVAQLTPEMANLWHMGTGVSGEAGELLDAIKRYAVYGKPLDQANVIEELGDLEFFMEAIRQAIGISREDVLECNINKLQARYASKRFTNAEAIARADKEGEG